jgi:histidine decarboxylase
MSNIIKNKCAEAISPYDNYCDGFGSPGASGKCYMTGIVLDVGVTEKKYSHEGSIVLDSILSFDKAEVESVNIGQINMVTVSSFCGLAGLVWGYDIAKHPKIHQPHQLFPQAAVSDIYFKTTVPVYSAVPLKEATYRLFGTMSKKRFPLLPGAHVPCAGKHINLKGPKHIYAALALGIAKNRDEDACVFMEDIGEIIVMEEDNKTVKFMANNKDFDHSEKLLEFHEQIAKTKNKILENLANSVLEIGKNQKIEFKEIFVDIVDIVINENQIGCALVAAPYFTIAKNSLPANNIEKLTELDLFSWEKEISKNFLENKK